MIKIRDLAFEYFDRDDEGNLTEMIHAIRGIHFDAKEGDFIAVAGRNGSGKSTFAKILNRLLVPIEGTVVIGGWDAMDEANTMDIRRTVGMVFQNPDDQLIGSIVAEDVAFGAENIGVSESKLWERVLRSIEQAGLVCGRLEDEYGTGQSARKGRLRKMADKRISELSGGEKQKVAIAGVLAMRPRCIVLDEATSMLDPKSRFEILHLMRRLNEEQGITIIMITHMMDELLFADTIYVMDKGRLAMKGRKEGIFAQADKLRELGLGCPEIISIRDRLLQANLIGDESVYTADEMVSRLKKEHPWAFLRDVSVQAVRNEQTKIDPVNSVLVNEVSFGYGNREILHKVSFGVAKGEYVAVVGATGSGKSTLLQHIPGLLRAKSGTVYVDGLDVADRSVDIRALRCKIGYVFQYPEQQLFAKNVYEDVVFGPRNVGISEVEAEKRAYEAIALAGLSDEIYDMPVSKLSGGEKRRVALAGVLAMKPEYLILDEPTAGLDPEGRRNMLQIIEALHREAGITIIMVSHDIESVAAYADRVIVMENGKIRFDGRTEQVFYSLALERLYENRSNEKTDMKGEDSHSGIGAMWDVPVMTELLVKLRCAGLPVDCMAADMERGMTNIAQAMKR